MSISSPLAPSLTADEQRRYHRHLILPEVGEEGQRRLKASRVLLIGAGGLGAPAALYLAAAGVGHLGIVDADTVEVSNLQRQVIHDTDDVDRAKVTSAESRIHALNPHVDVATYRTRLTSGNAMDLLADYDVIVDGSDNFATRYLVNDACVLLRKPDVSGSVLRFEGQASWRHSGCRDDQVDHGHRRDAGRTTAARRYTTHAIPNHRPGEGPRMCRLRPTGDHVAHRL